MKRYRISIPARADLREIFRYISSDNRRAAEGVIDRMVQQFRLLGEAPNSGELRPDVADLIPDARSISSGSYVIYFRPTSMGVEILRVVHGSRDVRNALD